MDVTEQLDEEQEQGGSEDAGGTVSEFETKDGKPYADDYSNLNDDRLQELRSICDAMDQRDEWARMIEIIRCTLRRYFLIGQQHPTWNSDAGQFQVGPSGVTLGDEDEKNAEEFFEEEFNIYRGYHVTCSIPSSRRRLPRPLSSSLQTDRRQDSREGREGSWRNTFEVYQKYNPPKVAQQSDVARLMCGPTAASSRSPNYEVDEEKCGHRSRTANRWAQRSPSFSACSNRRSRSSAPYRDWPYYKVSQRRSTSASKPRTTTRKSPGSACRRTPKARSRTTKIARMSRIAVDEGIAQVSSRHPGLSHHGGSLVVSRPAAFRHLDKDRRDFLDRRQDDE